MSGNIAVIYDSDVEAVASAFGEAAAHLAAQVCMLPLPHHEARAQASGPPVEPDVHVLEWADGIAFGTPVGRGQPSAALMEFLRASGPVWSSGRLWQKVVTVFTDEPERFAPDSVLHPVYDALYQWGAVIIGPRALELGARARPGRELTEPAVVTGSRVKAAQYRAVRLARLVGVVADQRHGHERLLL